jgi:anti-sigma factor RsiW
MSWRCFVLRRKFVPYLDGEVTPREEKRLDDHLAVCPACRERLTSVCAGHRAARQLGRLGPETSQRPPEFDELWASVGARLERSGQAAQTGRAMPRPLPVPLAAATLAVLVLAFSVLLVKAGRKFASMAGDRTVMPAGAGGRRAYVPLRIAEFPSKAGSPVVTEGYVRGVYFDQEEKTLHIKLVDNQQQPEPFVICEVRSFGRVAIPEEGSRVRVYGTARFDSQPGRGWNEVNPVTNIDILKR